MKGRLPKALKTMDDIARLAGVSKPTVSRALHDSPLVTAETKQRVLEVALRHGYVVNRNAQNLRRRRNNTIIVVIDFPSLPDHRLSDPFHFELLANVTNALAVRNQDLLLCSPQHADEQMYETMLLSKGADGIIFLGQGGRQPALRKLAKTRLPFVVWGSPADGASYCVVGSDNFRGGLLAGKRFAEIGRKRPVFLGPRGHPEIEARHAGLAEGMAKSSNPPKIIAPTLEDLSYKSSFEALRRLLERGDSLPDAVFGASDTIAIAAIAALREGGIRVPEDCSVIGYDDSPAASYHVPPLTTVRQDTRLAGAVLVENLMQILDGARPKPVLLPTELVVRST